MGGAAVVVIAVITLKRRPTVLGAIATTKAACVDVWAETRAVCGRHGAAFVGSVVGALIAGLTVQALNGWSLDKAAERLELERALLANSGLRVIDGPGRMGRVLVLAGTGSTPEVVPCPPNWVSAAEAADICLVLDGGAQ